MSFSVEDWSPAPPCHCWPTRPVKPGAKHARAMHWGIWDSDTLGGGMGGKSRMHASTVPLARIDHGRRHLETSRKAETSGTLASKVRRPLTTVGATRNSWKKRSPSRFTWRIGVFWNSGRSQASSSVHADEDDIPPWPVEGEPAWKATPPPHGFGCSTAWEWGSLAQPSLHIGRSRGTRDQNAFDELSLFSSVADYRVISKRTKS